MRQVKLTRKSAGLTAAAACAAWGIFNLSALLAQQGATAASLGDTTTWNLLAAFGPLVMSAISAVIGAWPATDNKQKALKFAFQTLEAHVAGDGFGGLDLKYYTDKGLMIPLVIGNTTGKPNPPPEPAK